MLSLKTDFNLDNAYKIFDPQNMGGISRRRFEEGYNIQSIYPKGEEIALFMLRYDKD